ncbi:MAG: FAD-dependent oxidoreductase, partial [Planctomycetales bacterium]
LNGVQKKQNTHSHRFFKKVDPYIRPGDPKSGLLPGVHGESPGEDGQGDRRIQAYCYRMCMSNVLENRIPFPKPQGYDEQRYELLLRNFEAGDLRLPLKLDMMPNGKTDTNNQGAFSTDNLGMNYDYAEADYAERERILQEHATYQQGLMWTLANHPRAPDSIRRTMSRWGLAKDEFTGTGGWPHQIYVREARRMIGVYVTTEQDCRRLRVVEDSIGLGSYNMDSHNAQRYVTPEGGVQNEGDVQVSPGGAYIVSYRSIIPQRAEAANLLVPVCVSSSHIAYGSIRMEPVFMILGQSAATAASLAIADGLAVQDVSYDDLREVLVRDKQALDLPANSRAKRSVSVPVARLKGVVVDDEQAKYQGEWPRSASVGPFVGRGYRHDEEAGKDARTATFEAKLKPGRYEVRLAHTAHENRAQKVSVVIRHASGEKQVALDQTKTPGIDGLFVSLGEYSFDESSLAAVVVSNAGTSGYVVVDAVQFLPVKK